MKLTKYEKQAITKAIMQDVPRTPDSVLRVEIEAAMIAAMSAPVRKLYKTHPKALRTERVSSWDSGISFSIDVVVGDADKEAVLKPFAARKQAFDAAYNKLNAIVESCSTLAQLKSRLPEFDAYFPTEQEPTKNLPALANMVADLSKLGWPKGKTQPSK